MKTEYMRQSTKYSKYLILFSGILYLVSLGSCSGTKFLATGENLYVKGQVKLQPDTSFNIKYLQPLEEHLEGMLRPAPAGSFLGMRPRIYIYNKYKDTKSEKGIKGWLKNKVGRVPVLLSDVNRPYNESLLKNRLENLGFFQAEVTSDTTIKKREATITYFAKTNPNYKIDSVQFDVNAKTTLGRSVLETKENSLLKKGRPYNLDMIKNERDRIDNDLKEKGFYYIDPDNFLVQVDSTIGKHRVNMFVKLKEETPIQARQQFHINNIYIYPSYSLSQGDYPIGRPDSILSYKGLYIFDANNSYRKSTIANTIFFQKGDLYSRSKHNLAISQLVGLGTFKFVKNNFTLVDSTRNLLDVYYYLTPLPKKAIRLEVIAKTASVYNGSEVNLSWLNRNFFKGAELFRLSVFGGYEFQTGGNVDLNSTFYRYGTQAKLTIPRLVVPFFNWSPSRRYVPHTNITAGYEFMNRRNAYRLNSLSLSYGFVWKETVKKEHELNIVDISLVRPGIINPAYQDQIENNPNLRHAIERQFTFGPNYYFTYTNTMENQRTNTQYFRGGVDFSGNIYGLIVGADYKKGDIHQLLNTDFSQYVKVEGDFRNYTKVNTKSQVALRAMMGVGYAYGNSNTMPYVKQFYTGGPNSIRAFRARELGPGSFNPFTDAGIYIPDMTGDIKMEFNAEYRRNLFNFGFGSAHGATFVDAGNIWLLHKDPNKPGGEFSKDFLKELAVGAGAGLRFDFNFLILRTDLAIPLRIPYLPSGERWVLNKIDFGSAEWRKSNLIFNLAIGYPF